MSGSEKNAARTAGRILVGKLANRLRELAIMIPEIRRRKAPHKGLQRPASKSASAFLARSSSQPASISCSILLSQRSEISCSNHVVNSEKLLRRELLNRQFKFYRGHMTTLRRIVDMPNILCQRFVVRLQRGYLGQAKDLCHTVKSHSVAGSGTNSGYIDSNGSVVLGTLPNPGVTTASENSCSDVSNGGE